MLVVSDSICAGIRDKEINQTLREHCNSNSAHLIKVEKHLGATAHEINFYSKCNIEHLKPKQLVVCAGANDLSHDAINAPDAIRIANSIANIGIEARQNGVPEIAIMSVINRRDRRYNQLTAKVNLQLRYACQNLGFKYIDNNYIKTGDLQRDGLHVNFQGKQKLIHSILSSSPVYNPSYGYMWNNICKWGVNLN